jgi:hypothetical protein
MPVPIDPPKDAPLTDRRRFEPAAQRPNLGDLKKRKFLYAKPVALGWSFTRTDDR